MSHAPKEPDLDLIFLLMAFVTIALVMLGITSTIE